jgi:hypothetical protein
MKRFDEALEIICEGENLSLQHGRITVLPGLLLNKAYAYSEQGNIKDSIPNFALAYYGSEIVERSNNQKKIIEYVNEHIKISLD